MTEFKLPDIGEGIVECEVMEWKIAEGDRIEEDQPVVEVMTDKALVEITAPEAGVVTRLHVAKGEMARVHAPLFAYQGDSEAAAGDADEAGGDALNGQQDAACSAETAPAATASNRRRVDFVLPDIGEGIVECEVVEWHVAVGDSICEDQRLVDVMTDKAMVEITAPEDGVVEALYAEKGDMAKVHAPLFGYLADGVEEGPAGPAAQAAPADSAESRPTAEGSSASATIAGAATREQRAHEARGAGRGAFGRVPASPAVRRLVREHQLRLEEVPGSGRDGRVLKHDVLAFLEQGQQVDDQQQRDASHQPVQADRSESSAVERSEPLRGVRAAMAKQMVTAASTVPHFQYGEEIDVTELLALRERLKPVAEKQEIRLTVMPFFIKALALALKDYPIVQARLDDQVTQILYPSQCNVGMAVDGKAGLMVPNIKGCERLTLLEIAGEVQRLTSAAREGRVSASDLKGGTISISNIGAIGGTYAAPIINVPESAIVAIGKTQWLPRFDDAGNVMRRAIMTATWAGDHRLLDGGTIARFCNAWKGYLEAPESMLLHLA